MASPTADSELLPPPTVEEEQTVSAADAADEVFCFSVRDEILTLARSQQDKREEIEAQDRIGASTVIKAYDTALKWHRAGREIRDRRREIDHDRMLIEHEREMAGLGRRGAAH